MKISALLIGESWNMHVMETKGADVFSYDTYDTGIRYIEKALNTEDIEFHHMPCHMVSSDFPQTAEELRKLYDVILISDCGANTFLLPVKTFLQYIPTPNKLELLRDYVKMGGGLCMVGGYLSFMGIEGKGRYNATPIEQALPVNFLPYDDRVELPQGVNVEVDSKCHVILNGQDATLPTIFGYNRAEAKADADVILSHNGDPIISLMEYGDGRSVACAMDCAPHWSSPEFCESEAYKKLWTSMVRWMARKI